MSEVQAADSVIRQAGSVDVNADPRAEFGKSTSDTSTPIGPQSTVKRNSDSPDEERDARAEEGRSF